MPTLQTTFVKLPDPRMADIVCSHSTRPTISAHLRAFAMVALTALLASTTVGCTSWRNYVHNGFKVGPNYCKPNAEVAEHWIEADNPLVSSAPAKDVVWWKSLHDPILNSLINAAYEQNLTVQAAGMRIEEARAQRRIAAGNLFPQTQQAFGEYQRTTLSKNSPNRSANVDFHYDQWTTGAGLAWELDFWGYYRRALEAADANLNVSIEDYDAAIVLLLSEVAGSYVELRTAEQRLEYARENVKIQRRSLDLATVKFTNGATTRLDVTQGESNLGQTEATIPPLETARRQAANQLCILLGMPPHNIEELLQGRKPIPSVAPQVAVGIPADLLRRRPDIRAAERTVAAQCAQIGVATAKLYPHFSITGTLYYDSANFSDLLSPNSFAGGVGPSFNWDILNYGRLVNNIKLQDARFQELALTYRQKVLNANAEAENALIAFLNAQRQVKSLTTSTDASQQSVSLVQDQYDAGKTDFNRVLTVERQLTQQQDSLAVAQGSVVQNLILLYKALGGGWQIRLREITTMGADLVGESEPLDVVQPQAVAEPVPAPAPAPMPEPNGK